MERRGMAPALVLLPPFYILSLSSCFPPAALHPTLFIPPCRVKNQLSNALFRFRDGAGGAEIWSRNVETVWPDLGGSVLGNDLH
eukprot:scaffold216355_cov32-Tisochrysis_lutea.AAC.1